MYDVRTNNDTKDSDKQCTMKTNKFDVHAESLKIQLSHLNVVFERFTLHHHGSSIVTLYQKK